MSISVKVPNEIRQGHEIGKDGVDSKGQKLKNLSQINLTLEKTLENQNAEGTSRPGKKPIGSNAMTYVVVDLPDGEQSRVTNLEKAGAEALSGSARPLMALAPNMHVVNTSMVASHLHKQTMPFNHFIHPTMDKAAGGH